MQPLFDPKLVVLVKEGHEYYVEVDGKTKKFPSLSRILSRTGLNHEYGGDIPAWVLEKAARRGDQVHLHAADLATGKQISPSEEVKPYTDAAASLIKKYRMKASLVETSLYNPIFDYCCTPDFVGTVKGRPSIVDWKTTSTVYWQAGFQLAGQALCFREPEAFDLYIGDLRQGVLTPFVPQEYLRLARTAFQLYNEIQDMEDDKG